MSEFFYKFLFFFDIHVKINKSSFVVGHILVVFSGEVPGMVSRAAKNVHYINITYMVLAHCALVQSSVCLFCHQLDKGVGSSLSVY